MRASHVMMSGAKLVPTSIDAQFERGIEALCARRGSLLLVSKLRILGFFARELQVCGAAKHATVRAFVRGFSCTASALCVWADGLDKGDMPFAKLGRASRGTLAALRGQSLTARDVTKQRVGAAAILMLIAEIRRATNAAYREGGGRRTPQ